MTLEEISHLLSNSAEQFLSKAGNFELHAETAVNIINDITGEAFTTDIEFDAGNAWLRSVFAWIIEYTASRKLSAGSDSYVAQTAKNYDLALKTLAGHRIKKIRSEAKAELGKIENLYENE